MKRVLLGTLCATFLLGAGTVVFATSNTNEENKTLNFDKMKPFMEKMHPDLSNDELEDMYQACHGNSEDQNIENQLNQNPENVLNNL